MASLIVSLAVASYRWRLDQELVGAAADGDSTAVRRLLDAGASANAVEWCHGFPALYEAAEGGHVEVMRLLLARGARSPWPGTAGEWNPLWRAVSCRQPEAVDLLLIRGVDVNSPDHGHYLLHEAASGGDCNGDAVGTVRGLLAHGARVMLRDSDGRTALETARHALATADDDYAAKYPSLRQFFNGTKAGLRQIIQLLQRAAAANEPRNRER